jgi:enterochelin esterase-like enzyme
VGLTSGTFSWLMAAAAAGSLAAVVWAWPRLAGPHPAALAGRLAVLAGAQVLVVAAFLVWLNGYFAFYASWGELLGTPQARTAAAVTRVGTGLRPAGLSILRSGPGPVPWGGAMPLAAARASVAGPGELAAAPAAGELLQVELRGQRTGLSSGPGYVYLPPQYFQPAYARTRFPVLLALTGYPGQAVDLVHQLGLPALAARLAALGRIRPAVIVMLNVSPLLPMDTECTDAPGGPQVESFYAQDVPVAIEHEFRVTASPRGWGVLGYSTGGYCAAKLAMMYPSRFSAAVSMAGYYDAEWGYALRHQWGGSGAYQNENNLDWRLRQLPAPPVSVLVTSSRVGELSLPGTLRFLRLIHPPMRGYSLIVPQGGHNFGTWRRELPQSLEWLSQRLR